MVVFGDLIIEFDFWNLQVFLDGKVEVEKSSCGVEKSISIENLIVELKIV
jgi:hypothetical protein